MAGLPSVTAATSGVEPLFSQFKAVPAAPSVSLPLSSAHLPFKENRDSRGAFLKIDFTTTRVGLESPRMPVTCRFLGFTQTC